MQMRIVASRQMVKRLRYGLSRGTMRFDRSESILGLWAELFEFF